MSGVFGIIHPKYRERISTQVDDMSQCLDHFSWNQIETFVDVDAGVGLGRIGIGIFNQESQPVFSSDKRIIVLACGEFYGASNLDGKGGENLVKNIPAADFVLDLYERCGIEFIPRLEGVFQFVIYDKRNDQVILANDRFGLYPLYFAKLPQGLLFAPEIKGVLSNLSMTRKIDFTAVAEYMRFQCLLGERTFFEDIHVLPPATILTYSLFDNKIETSCYWDFSMIQEKQDKVTFTEAAHNAGELFKKAVRKQLDRNENPGIYLSGGLDSRVILGMALKVRNPLVTITYGLPGCRDVVIADQIARIAKTDHHFFEITSGEWVKEFIDLHFALTEGSHSWIHSHGISILGMARPLMNVNLNGLNGAELNWDDPLLYQEQNDLNLAIRLFSALTCDTTWPSLSESEEFLLYDSRVSKDLLGRAFSSLQTRLSQMSHLSCRQKVSSLSFEIVRRLFMYYTVFNRSHIEQRYPFYDVAYLGYIHSLPLEMILGRRLRREVLREYCPEFVSFPYAKDGVPVCHSERSRILSRYIVSTKSAFNRHMWRLFPELPELYVDYETWLRGELRDWGEELFLGEQTLQRGVFNPDFLRALWRRFQSGSEANLIGKIAPIMTVEMVFREFQA
jgi:asparagine synthase (glutamine-hydrolysing)